ncbi:MAG: YcxB family protein [Sandaracinaceae bacterium]
MDEVEADIELTERDHVDAHLGLAKARNAYRAMQTYMGLMLFIVGAIVVSHRPTPGVWTAMGVALLAGIVLVRQQWVWIGKKGFALLPKARRRFRVAFGLDGIRQQGPKAEVNLAWAAMDGWHETEETLMVYGPTGLLAFWGKRHFDEDALRSVRALLTNQIEIPEAPAPVEVKSSSAKTLVLWIVLVIAFVAIYQLVGRS